MRRPGSELGCVLLQTLMGCSLEMRKGLRDFDAAKRKLRLDTRVVGRVETSYASERDWLRNANPAFQLMIATSWIAPVSCRDIQDQRVQRACDTRPNWDEYLRLIDRHRTTASSWAALKRTSSVHVPEQVRQELQRRSDFCRWQAMLQLQQLAGVLKPLNQSGIPVMPLKGPLLSFVLYGDIGLRQSKDLDILVPQWEIRRAQECLQDLGWRLGAEYFPLSPRQWEATFRHEWHVGYVHPQQGGALELHWRLSSRPRTEQYWTRSRTSELSGLSYRTMCDSDLAIYLSGHGGVHEWFRAKWLGDLARLHCNGQVEWTDVLKQASTMSQERPVLLAVQLLGECYDLAFPALPGSLRGRLPSPLVRRAVRALTDDNEPTEQNTVASFIQNYCYKQMLWPNKRWWSEIFYRRLDFRVVRLPDRTFWLYIPLRPILWLWRRLWEQTAASNVHREIEAIEPRGKRTTTQSS